MRSAEKEEEDPGVEAGVEEIDQEIVTDDEDHGPVTRKVKESEDIQVIATVTGGGDGEIVDTVPRTPKVTLTNIGDIVIIVGAIKVIQKSFQIVI